MCAGMRVVIVCVRAQIAAAADAQVMAERKAAAEAQARCVWCTRTSHFSTSLARG
jgi:hypothetical protein